MGRFILFFLMGALLFALICDLLLIAGTLRILNLLKQRTDQINQQPKIELYDPCFEPTDSLTIQITASETEEF